MANASKPMIIGSMAASGLVAIACLLDIFLGFPFAGRVLFDILFLLASAIVLYMGWDAYSELK